MKKKSTKNMSGLVVSAVGVGVVVLAMLWSAYSANDPNIVGANIGAGLVGLFGFAVALAGLVLVAIEFITKK